MIAALLILAVAAIAAAGYGLWEANGIRVKKYCVSLSQLRGKRLVVFSDVHLGGYTKMGQLHRCVEAINQQDADWVAFAGDFSDKYRTDYSEIEEPAIDALQKIRAKQGKFAVTGNNDKHKKQAWDFAALCLVKGGFTLLRNENVSLAEDVYFVGVEETKFGPTNLKKALSGVKGRTILLVHQPDFVEEAAKYGVDLQICGHSHGGQIWIPFLGPKFLPEGAKKYARGVHTLEKTTLYISNGVGVHTLPFRFLARPDILVFDFE